MSEIESLRLVFKTRPRFAVQWATRFSFCNEKAQVEREGYAEKAFLAYQIINWAANNDIKLVVEWVIGQCMANSYLPRYDTFGNHPSVEFDNVKSFADHLMGQILASKPWLVHDHVIRMIGEMERIEVSGGSRGHFNHLIIQYLVALFKKRPDRALRVVAQLWRGPYDRTVYLFEQFLLDAYKTNPEKVLRFFERQGSRLSGFGQTMDKVIGS